MLKLHVTYISRFDSANIQFMRVINTIYATYQWRNTCSCALNIYEIFTFLFKTILILQQEFLIII